MAAVLRCLLLLKLLLLLLVVVNNCSAVTAQQQQQQQLQDAPGLLLQPVEDWPYEDGNATQEQSSAPAHFRGTNHPGRC